MNSIVHTRWKAYKGFFLYRRLLRRYHINEAVSIVLLISKEEDRLNEVIFKCLDRAIREFPLSGKRMVYLLTDKEDINISSLSELVRRAIVLSSADMESIVCAYCMYRFSDSLYLGMLNGLQGRGGAEALSVLDLTMENIVRYGILYPQVKRGREFSGILHRLMMLTVFAIYSILGEGVYKKISRELENKNPHFFIYSYSGIGDVYVLSLYMQMYIQRRSDASVYLIVQGDTCCRAARLCGIRNAMGITQRQMKLLEYYARLPGRVQQRLHMITPFPVRVNTDIYSGYLYGRCINMADAYRYVMFQLTDRKVIYPYRAMKEEQIQILAQKYDIPRGKTVILAPYANTTSTYPMSVWHKIADRLGAMGYSVYTNVTANEQELEGTMRLECPLEDIRGLVDYAENFIGIRSGICDIICDTMAQKCILYPEYERFNATLYDFCSFEKMGLGKNISEIRWGFEDYDNLIERVLKWQCAASQNREEKGI